MYEITKKKKKKAYSQSSFYGVTYTICYTNATSSINEKFLDLGKLDL